MSPELKSISPYLQRADELQTKEPVMAYWCMSVIPCYPYHLR
jgi:vacuolar protein sorting-associated protein VTA1